LHNTYLDSIQDETERFNTFVELNVKEQVLICKNINRSGSMAKQSRSNLARMGIWIKSGFVTDLNVNISQKMT
jgi:carbonic anhydrase